MRYTSSVRHLVHHTCLMGFSTDTWRCMTVPVLSTTRLWMMVMRSSCWGLVGDGTRLVETSWGGVVVFGEWYAVKVVV